MLLNLYSFSAVKNSKIRTKTFQAKNQTKKISSSYSAVKLPTVQVSGSSAGASSNSYQGGGDGKVGGVPGFGFSGSSAGASAGSSSGILMNFSSHRS